MRRPPDAGAHRACDQRRARHVVPRRHSSRRVSHDARTETGILMAVARGPVQPSKTPAVIRLADVLGALSVATDLGMGQPMEHAMQSCVLAVRLGEALRLSDGELADVYWQALLRFIGCNAETTMLASIVGGELLMRGRVASVDPGRATEVVGLILRSIREANAGRGTIGVARAMARGLLSMPELK